MIRSVLRLIRVPELSIFLFYGLILSADSYVGLLIAFITLSVAVCRFSFLFLDLFYLIIRIPSYLSASRPSNYDFLIHVYLLVDFFYKFITCNFFFLFESYSLTVLLVTCLSF